MNAERTDRTAGALGVRADGDLMHRVIVIGSKAAGVDAAVVFAIADRHVTIGLQASQQRQDQNKETKHGTKQLDRR